MPPFTETGSVASTGRADRSRTQRHDAARPETAEDVQSRSPALGLFRVGPPVPNPSPKSGHCPGAASSRRRPDPGVCREVGQIGPIMLDCPVVFAFVVALVAEINEFLRTGPVPELGDVLQPTGHQRVARAEGERLAATNRDAARSDSRVTLSRAAIRQPRALRGRIGCWICRDAASSRSGFCVGHGDDRLYGLYGSLALAKTDSALAKSDCALARADCASAKSDCASAWSHFNE